MLMKAQLGMLSVAALAAMLASPLTLASPAHADAFMQQAIQGNLAEIKQGELAEHMGATEGVRRFGAVLVHDHSKANQKAMAAASSMGVTPPAEPGGR
jgi:putative membrane protein